MRGGVGRTGGMSARERETERERERDYEGRLQSDEQFLTTDGVGCGDIQGEDVGEAFEWDVSESSERNGKNVLSEERRNSSEHVASAVAGSGFFVIVQPTSEPEPTQSDIFEDKSTSGNGERLFAHAAVRHHGRRCVWGE